MQLTKSKEFLWWLSGFELEVEALREQRDMIQNAFRGMRSGAEVCVARHGGHVEGRTLGLIVLSEFVELCYF